MKKFIFCLLSVFIATSAMGDILRGPNPKLEGLKQQEYSKCTYDKPLLKMGTITGKIRDVYTSGAGWSCMPCDWDGVAVMGCEKCPNRVNFGDRCYLKCPNDKPLRSEYNGCQPCDTDVGALIGGCEKCPNRLKDISGCPKKCLDKAKPLLSLNKGCQPCDTTGIGIYGCEKCPNRVKIGDKCYQKCPDDKPLLFSDGSCQNCDAQEKNIGKFSVLIISGCEKCPNRKCSENDIERIVNNIKQETTVVDDAQGDVLTPITSTQKSTEPCPDDKPLNVGNGKCESCDTDKIAFGTNCEKCPNRNLVGSFCLKNRRW